MTITAIRSYPVSTHSKRVLLGDMPRAQQIVAVGPVVAGYERLGWPWDDLLRNYGYELEVAVYDHLQCLNCRAANSGECRSSLGQMRYTGLIREGCVMYQAPCFGAVECGGPASWAARYAARINAGAGWIGEKEVRPRAQAAGPAEKAQPARTIIEVTGRIASRFRTGGASR